MLVPLTVLLPLAGCATGSPQHPATQPAISRQALDADRRLVPPDLTWTLADGARMPLRVWQPPPGATRAVVLALHGFNDSRDAWELSGPALAAHGIAVYAPDQRGFGQAPDRGRWPGSDRLVDDAAQMARLAAATHPGLPLYVMGESMGGAVALCLAARAGAPSLAGVILLAPAVWSSTRMSPLLTASLWAAATLTPDWRLTGREVALHVVASDNLAALYRLSYDPLTLTGSRTTALRGLVQLMTRAAASALGARGRVLMAYGAHDDLVPAGAMAATWARLPPQVRRAYYPHGYHLLMRDGGRDAVIADIVSWTRDPGRPLPSGADVAASAWSAGASWQTSVPVFLPSGLDNLAGGS
ncbi:alpha/beta fold hydrolase [Lichenicoccus sp.]|uniref:alpha/beta fold hydrolase n=1 Tax=Lichenicoccus sp. TaxID=2781899 RepID=UPI003D0F7829